MHAPKLTTTLGAAALLTTATSAQSSTSSFNWDSLISEAATETTTFDLYTTNGSLGPGVLDTSSRYGLYTSATPIMGPIGNGTVANGTAPPVNGSMTTMGGGGAGMTTGTAASSGAGGSDMSSSSGPSVPAATGNGAAGGGLWLEGAGLMVGIGAVMAAL